MTFKNLNTIMPACPRARLGPPGPKKTSICLEIYLFARGVQDISGQKGPYCAARHVPIFPRPRPFITTSSRIPDPSSGITPLP
jgi:hypothetical protein